MWTKVKKQKQGRVKENQDLEDRLVSKTDQGSNFSNMGATFRKVQ